MQSFHTEIRVQTDASGRRDIASEIEAAGREYATEDDEQVFDGIDGVLDVSTRYRMDYGPVSVSESGVGAVQPPHGPDGCRAE